MSSSPTPKTTPAEETAPAEEKLEFGANAEDIAADRMATIVAEEVLGEAKKAAPAKGLLKAVVELDIKKDDIGKFVGGGGSKIKDFVINKTRAQVEDGKGLFCQIISKGEAVFARLKAADDEAMEKIKENLMTHQTAFEKQKKFAGQSRFVFKHMMDHFKIAKFIGARGANINELKKKIASEDVSLTNDKVFIQIKEDEPFRMTNMKFVDCAEEGTVLTGGHVVRKDSPKVLITVSVYTEDREKSVDVIRKLVGEAVDRVYGYEEGDHASNELDEDEDPFEDSGW